SSLQLWFGARRTRFRHFSRRAAKARPACNAYFINSALTIHAANYTYLGESTPPSQTERRNGHQRSSCVVGVAYQNAVASGASACSLRERRQFRHAPFQAPRFG